MNTILIIGGAGYIGSHLVKYLSKKNYRLLIVDNLSSGYVDAVLAGEFFIGDLAEKQALTQLLSHYPIDAVMHFAAHIEVAESKVRPDKYYDNNVVRTLNLLDAMVAANVKRFIFSSTAAIFGEPQYVPIDEKHPQYPINPYGRSKLMVEQILRDYDEAFGLKSVCLRYFNAAGADPEGELGERHVPETHLIPLVLQTAAGRREFITIFGEDYDTPDGTCIRDYIHINDLCQAHELALQRLLSNQPSAVYNLGNGEGFSVRQVIDTARQVTGKTIPVQIGTRRAGDPARLVADSRLARQELGWQPQYPDLKSIIADAWRWEQRL
ncbi:UDP-glucose 4-epimerase GalE [Thioflexithrix psekupsensis]|uniref:UDP-glucose 4-epimerase n=1 Tax=Thioflexithrix psekupsensis TaxID=1570016 RepID=A0A251X5T8_9GAMM|nr:UDP-glucose 4-epimerase GalE [Thioflexithrix psekupsensis]OUD12468.1 UDP-glucose 4-epimerase GalE [Thioflexithrix psekupsensis]